MKDKNLSLIGSLIGGVVHNLNTPLMWVMGRAQLIQARNEKLDTIKGLPPEEIAQIKEKNDKDIKSILEGAEKIDSILKALGFKMQMVNEGYTSVELREYLENEVNFLMADMQFKHNTKREFFINSRSCYVKVDYNALSGAVTGIINAMINHTEKGRTIRVALENGVINLFCPEFTPSEESQKEIEAACIGLMSTADIIMDGGQGFKVSIALKDV
jgi:signal transduction histidine kinase